MGRLREQRGLGGEQRERARHEDRPGRKQGYGYGEAARLDQRPHRRGWLRVGLGGTGRSGLQAQRGRPERGAREPCKRARSGAGLVRPRRPLDRQHGSEDSVGPRRRIGNAVGARSRGSSGLGPIPRRGRLDRRSARHAAPPSSRTRTRASHLIGEWIHRYRPLELAVVGQRAARLFDLRQPAQLSGFRRIRRDASSARDCRGDADGLARRTHIHIPHPSRFPLLASVA
jgi:hypothetical protein